MTYRQVPIIEKYINYFEKRGIKSISCSMQGWRKNMEDSYSMTELPSGIMMYGVYDGHGGDEISNFASKYLPEVFKNLEHGFTDDEVKKGFIELDNLLSSKNSEIFKILSNQSRINPTLKSDILEYRSDNPEMSIDEVIKELICDLIGSTATVIFIDNDRIVTATLGDCQAVLYRKNGEVIELQETIHNFNNEIESKRVRDAGLEVSGHPLRISSELAVSRSFGNMRFKKQGTPKLSCDKQPISVVPDITIKDRTDQDNFLLIASDGIFEVLSCDKVVGKIKTYINQGLSIEDTLKNLLDDCLCPTDSKGALGKDNMTALFVKLQNNKLEMTAEQLSEYEKYRFNECHGGC